MPADLLEVEITETALVADPSRVVPVLERLGALGIRVAIDDFGIGNTSISQLRDLPVDELKIDRLFVADLGVDGREGSEVVVQAMVDLAHSFDLRVVAEGVEDESTAVILRRLGVDQAQGFLYSQAVPADDLPLTPSVPRPRRDRGGRAAVSRSPATRPRHDTPRASAPVTWRGRHERVSIVRSAQVGRRDADRQSRLSPLGGFPHDGRPAAGDDRPRAGAPRRTAATAPVDHRGDRRPRGRRRHDADHVGHLHRQRRDVGRRSRAAPSTWPSAQDVPFAFAPQNLAPGDSTFVPLQVHEQRLARAAVLDLVLRHRRDERAAGPGPRPRGGDAGDLRDVLELSVYARRRRRSCTAAGIGARDADQRRGHGHRWPATVHAARRRPGPGARTRRPRAHRGRPERVAVLPGRLPARGAGNEYQDAGVDARPDVQRRADGQQPLT